MIAESTTEMEQSSTGSLATPIVEEDIFEEVSLQDTIKQPKVSPQEKKRKGKAEAPIGDVLAKKSDTEVKLDKLEAKDQKRTTSFSEGVGERSFLKQKKKKEGPRTKTIALGEPPLAGDFGISVTNDVQTLCRPISYTHPPIPPKYKQVAFPFSDANKILKEGFLTKVYSVAITLTFAAAWTLSKKSLF